MITGVNHYTIAITDINRSFDFYRNVLELKPLCKWPKGAYFLVGNFWLCLNVDENRQPTPDHHYTHFAFTVSQDNFDQMVLKLKKAGVQSFKENTSPGDSFYFYDPDGYKLEVHTGDWKTRLEAFKKIKSDVEYF